MSIGAENPEDKALAGEYVLGVLPLDERRAVEQRMARDAAFAELVGSWQADLSTMNEAYASGSPPSGIKARIDARLFANAANSVGLWGSLVFWRGLAFASVAALVAFGAYNFGVNGRLADPGEAPALIAELGAPGSAVGLVAALDTSTGALQVLPAAFSPDDGKALELWLVPAEGTPVSLGLVPGDGGRLMLDPQLADQLTAGALIAVSVEPEGGSPTGAPTGPVVLSGALARK